MSLLPTVLEFSQISALRDSEKLKIGVVLFRRRFVDVRALILSDIYFFEHVVITRITTNQVKFNDRNLSPISFARFLSSPYRSSGVTARGCAAVRFAHEL